LGNTVYITLGMNRGAGSNLKVYGHTSLARRTGEKSLLCLPLFSSPPHAVWGGTAYTRVGTNHRDRA